MTASLPKKFPEAPGHKIAFKGRRFLVVESNRSEDPEDEFSSEFHDLVVYDKEMSCVIGYASKRDGSGFNCFFHYGPHELECYAARVEDIGKTIDREVRQLISDGY